MLIEECFVLKKLLFIIYVFFELWFKFRFLNNNEIIIYMFVWRNGYVFMIDDYNLYMFVYVIK